MTANRAHVHHGKYLTLESPEDQEALEWIDKILFGSGNRDSLLCKTYGTLSLKSKIRDRKTAYGSTLKEVTQAGVIFKDKIGIFAPDPLSYSVFFELFNLYIEDLFPECSPSYKIIPGNYGNLDEYMNLDPTGRYVVSTRIRGSRNLEGYPFNPILTCGQYFDIEEKVSNVLRDHFKGALSGTYYRLCKISCGMKEDLSREGFLMGNSDSLLESAKAFRFWPEGRGVFHSLLKTELVWVNQQEHIRIASFEKGGDIKEVLRRYIQALNVLEHRLTFAFDEKFGFLAFNPTNVGTAFRITVEIRLPYVVVKPRFVRRMQNYCKRNRLGVALVKNRPCHFYVYSNCPLGFSEFEIARTLCAGVRRLIRMDKEIEEICIQKGYEIPKREQRSLDSVFDPMNDLDVILGQVGEEESWKNSSVKLEVDSDLSN